MSSADIKFYFSILIRWIPAAILVSCVTTALGIFAALALPSVYTSTATIVVEAPDLPTQLARSTVPQNAIAQVQLVREKLLTDSAIAAMAVTLELAPAGRQVSEEMIEGIRENTALKQTFFGSGDQVINAFTVSFSAPTPQRAALVANAFARLILANDLEIRQKRAADALAFFQDDVAGLNETLEASEARILAFKNENLAALPESLTFRRASIASAREALFTLQLEEAQARLQRASLVSSMQVTGQVTSEPQTPQSAMVGDLRRALATQMAVFTDDSPTIINLKARIAALEGTLPSLSAGADPATLPAEIQEIDARLADIAAEKDRLTNSEAALDASLEATPAIEARLRALELERDNIQTQYTAAVARLAEASAGERIETLLKGERLTLFQEAIVPLYAEGPQRKLIVLASAAGGLILVAGLALLQNLLSTKIRRPVDLQRKLSIQPLGVVPQFRKVRTRDGRSWSRQKADAVKKVKPVVARQSWTM